MTSIFILMEEVSDQYGTDKVAGVFSTRDLAEAFGETINRRTWVKEMLLDPPPRATVTFEEAIERSPLGFLFRPAADRVPDISPGDIADAIGSIQLQPDELGRPAKLEYGVVAVSASQAAAAAAFGWSVNRQMDGGFVEIERDAETAHLFQVRAYHAKGARP